MKMRAGSVFRHGSIFNPTLAFALSYSWLELAYLGIGRAIILAWLNSTWVPVLLFAGAFGEGRVLAAVESATTSVPSFVGIEKRKIDEWRRARGSNTRATEILVGTAIIAATLYNLFISVRHAPPGSVEVWLNVVMIATMAATSTLIAITGFARQIRIWAVAQSVALIFILGSTLINYWAGGEPVRALLWMPWLAVVYVQNAGVFLPRVALLISGLIFVVSLGVLAPYAISGLIAPGAPAFDILVIMALLHFTLIVMLYNVSSRREHDLASRAQAETELETAQDRARIEAELAAARLELAYVDRSLTISALAASIAHEIKQPLAAIISSGNASLNWLRREQPAIREAEDCNERILKDAYRASEIVISMRDLLKREKHDRESVDIAALLRDIESILCEEADAQGVALAIVGAEGLPRVDADVVQLRQVIVNLALNAMEASIIRPRGARPVTISVNGSESGVLIEVEDQGEGLSEGARAKMFEPFYTTKPGGMGLGLAICRTIVEQHGGTIGAEAMSPGARVFVTLPAASR